MSSISITNESQAERVELLSRLLARRVALGLALSRSDLKSAARAAGRIRLPDIGLSPEERNEARFARATLGRAIRDARVRSFRAPIARPVPQRVEILPPRSSRRRLALDAHHVHERADDVPLPAGARRQGEARGRDDDAHAGAGHAHGRGGPDVQSATWWPAVATQCGMIRTSIGKYCGPPPSGGGPPITSPSAGPSFSAMKRSKASRDSQMS